MSANRRRSLALDQALLPAIRRRLLAWFDAHQRDLPWRRRRDPYGIWVSEIMLQQTQAASVVPYFERFLQAFPTLTDLAAAAEHDVLRLWEGLGYYRRARHLHQAARLMRDRHAGQVPDDPQLLQKLPGIGRYTAAAVLSQAYDRRLPILEANSRRLLCRLLGLRRDPRRAPEQRRLWQTADLLLPDHRVGDFNQALMELGALVCTPATPRCATCPLADACAARRLGLQEAIPVRAPRPRTVAVREAAIVVHRGDRVLLVQRPDAGRWAGLWEFPHGPLANDDPLDVSRLLADLTGLDARIERQLLTLQHAVTHHRITLVCFAARHRAGRFRSPCYVANRWVRLDELPTFPVSAPQRRLAQALLRFSVSRHAATR